MSKHFGSRLKSEVILEWKDFYIGYKNLKEKLENDPSSKTVKDLIWLLFDTSLLSSGYPLLKPLDFTKRIHKLVELGLGGDVDSEEDEGVRLVLAPERGRTDGNGVRVIVEGSDAPFGVISIAEISLQAREAPRRSMLSHKLVFLRTISN